MNFYVGQVEQKLVCVNPGPTPSPLIKGAVYTVVDIASGVCVFSRRPTVGFILAEVDAPFDCVGFNANRFRPYNQLDEQMDRIESEGAPVEQPKPAFA